MRLVWSEDFRKERDKTRAWLDKRRMPAILACLLTGFASASTCLGQTVAAPVCMAVPATIVLACPFTWWGVLIAWPFAAVLLLIVIVCAADAMSFIRGVFRGVLIVDHLGIAIGGAIGVSYIVTRVTW